MVYIDCTFHTAGKKGREMNHVFDGIPSRLRKYEFKYLY